MKPINASLCMPLLPAALPTSVDITAAPAYAGPDAGDNPNCPAPEVKHAQSRKHERRAERLAPLKEKLELALVQKAAWHACSASLQFRMPHAETGRMIKRDESAGM